MDLDLEIISEEGDCPDPLFNSIMNAMNSMKEATADKIYQKIQKEGETNYSKPQVDRALASALKYGIFEVRNNRYRMRDDILDDEDTVYWKLKNSREESPFVPDEGLNPERDNLRFKKVSNPQDGQDRQECSQCPQCGRTKRPSRKLEGVKEKQRKKEKKAKPIKRQRKTKQNKKSEYPSSRKVEPRRRTRLATVSEERQAKVRKITGQQASGGMPTGEHLYYKEDLRSPRDKIYHGRLSPRVGKFDSTDESEVDSMSSRSDDGQSFTDYQDKRKLRKRRNSDLPQCFQDSVDGEMTQVNVSSPSFRSESDCEKSDGTSFSSHKGPVPFMDNLPCTSRSASTKEPTSRNQFIDSSELYGKQYGREQVDSTDRKPDWMGYADQPQGHIIETNNVLLIEPMDSMGFKSQEHASYIS